MKRLFLLIVAGVLAVSAAGGLGIYLLGRPEVLRIAVGPPDGSNWRLMTGAARVLERQHEDVRFRIRSVVDPRAAAEALERGEVDMAVVRSDVRLPANGHSVAIIQRQAGLFLAPAASPIAGIADLPGRTLAVVMPGQANGRLLDTVLTQHDIAPHTVARIFMPANALQDALATGKVDGVFLVSAIVDPLVTGVIAAMTAAGGATPRFLPVTDAEAIVQRDPTLEAVEVLRGAFGGSVPRPAESFTTIGVSNRLVADVELADGVVGEVTRVLFSIRPILARDMPAANRIQAPESEKASALPVHSGTIAYLQNEELTFFDRYGDLFYIGAMFASLAGSVVVGLASRLTARRRARAVAFTGRLVELMKEARTSRDEADLARLEQEADDLLFEAMEETAIGAVERTQLAAFTLALDETRRAIAGRRAALTERPA